MVPGKDVTNLSNNVDVLFVIDNTISMLAEDYDGDGRRMDAVKEDCKYIMEQFPGASFSVVTMMRLPSSNCMNLLDISCISFSVKS